MLTFILKISELFGSFHGSTQICASSSKSTHFTSLGHQDNKEIANKCKHGRQCNHWHHVGSQDTCTCCYSHVAISLYHQELHQVTNPQNSPIHLLSKIPDMGRIGNHFDQIKCRVITSLEYSTIMYHMYIQWYMCISRFVWSMWIHIDNLYVYTIYNITHLPKNSQSEIQADLVAS